MSRIQAHTLQNVIQPSLLLGIAMLAGSKRFISYFPNASKRGLLLSGTLGTGLIWGTSLKTDASLNRMIKATLSLAIVTLTTPLITKALNKKNVQLSFATSFRLAFAQGCVAGGLALIPQNNPNVSHQGFINSPDTWKDLPIPERTAYLKRFYDADLPPIPLEGATISFSEAFGRDPVAGFSYPDCSTLTSNQLGWWVEIIKHEQNVDTEGRTIHPDEFLLDLNGALLAHNLPTYWHGGFTQQHLDAAKNDARHVNTCYAYFSAHPFEFAKLRRALAKGFTQLFAGRDLIPSLRNYLEALSYEQFQQLSKQDLETIHALNEWDFLSLPDLQRVAFSATSHAHNLDTKFE